MRYLGADVEELMLLEAMRRSMQDTIPAPSPTSAPVPTSTTSAPNPQPLSNAGVESAPATDDNSSPREDI